MLFFYVSNNSFFLFAKKCYYFSFFYLSYDYFVAHCSYLPPTTTITWHGLTMHFAVCSAVCCEMQCQLMSIFIIVCNSNIIKHLVVYSGPKFSIPSYTKPDRHSFYLYNCILHRVLSFVEMNIIIILLFLLIYL